MTHLTGIFVASVLLIRAWAQDAEVFPRKGNMMTSYLNKTLNSLFDQLATKNLSIPEIDFGEVGKFTQIEAGVLGKMEKQLDGLKSFGFYLNMTLSDILASGFYDIVYLDVPGLFPVFGKGNFGIALEKISLNMTLKAEYSAADEKFAITIPDFDVLVENSTVKFENLMDDPFVADFLSELLSNLIPDLVSIFAKPAIESLHPVIDFYGNGIITCVKKELLTGKVDECIKNLFVKSMKPIEMAPLLKLGNKLKPT